MKIDTNKIRELFNEILNHQIANRNSKHAFYKSYTYNKTFPVWVKKAEKMIQELNK